MSIAHLVQGSHYFGSVGVVQSSIQSEVGFYSLNPLSGIVILSREVHREGGFSSEECNDMAGAGAGGAGGTGPTGSAGSTEATGGVGDAGWANWGFLGKQGQVAEVKTFSTGASSSSLKDRLKYGLLG